MHALSSCKNNTSHEIMRMGNIVDYMLDYLNIKNSHRLYRIEWNASKKIERTHRNKKFSF